MRKLSIKKIAVLATGSIAAVVSAASSSFALDWTGINLATGDVDSVMALVVVGLATLWGYRKVVKTMNRS